MNSIRPAAPPSYVAWSAASLARSDADRALKLLEVVDAEERGRYLGMVAVALATTDPDRAVKIAEGLDKRSTLSNNTKLRIAYYVGQKDPQKGLQIVEGIRDGNGDKKVQTDALGWLAVAVAPQDPQLAYSLNRPSLRRVPGRPAGLS